MVVSALEQTITAKCGRDASSLNPQASIVVFNDSIEDKCAGRRLYSHSLGMVVSSSRYSAGIVVCLDEPPSVYSSAFSEEARAKLQFLDFSSDPLGWDGECERASSAVDIDILEKTILMSASAVANPSSIAVFFDDTSALLRRCSLSPTLRMLRRLASGTSPALSLLALLFHPDLHDNFVSLAIEDLAGVLVRVKPPAAPVAVGAGALVSAPPEPDVFSCTILRKSNSGKVVLLHERFRITPTAAAEEAGAGGGGMNPTLYHTLVSVSSEGPGLGKGGVDNGGGGGGQNKSKASGGGVGYSDGPSEGAKGGSAAAAASSSVFGAAGDAPLTSEQQRAREALVLPYQHQGAKSSFGAAETTTTAGGGGPGFSVALGFEGDDMMGDSDDEEEDLDDDLDI